MQKVSPEDHAILPQLKKIYDYSFPPDERRDFDAMTELLKTTPYFTFYAIIKDDKTAGLFSTWDLGKIMFVEHIAVSEDFRGIGIGQSVLRSWLDQQKMPVVLEVERPNNEISVRRIAFYERLGFRHWNINYIQPAYSPGQYPVPLHLMTYGDIDLDISFKEIQQLIYLNVYSLTVDSGRCE